MPYAQNKQTFNSEKKKMLTKFFFNVSQKYLLKKKKIFPPNLGHFSSRES